MDWDRGTMISKGRLGEDPELNIPIPPVIERFNEGAKKVYEIHEDA
jgi:hypothetical protein